jgi:hypothetical protein
MIPKDIKTVGLKDMADEQIEAIMKMTHHALVLAQCTGDVDFYEEVLEDANDMVILLGGQSLQVGMSIEIEG